MKDDQYAFSTVTGQGLGISYSSLSQLSHLLPFRELGQAKLKCYLNVTNGNVMLQDHAVSVSEIGGPINLFYFYNSQAASPAECWRLSGSKQFTGLPDPKYPAPSVTLTEEDGHQTTYQYNSDIGAYVAPGLQNGTPYLYYDYHDNINQWVLYHPGTYQVEYYNQAGYLQKRFDLEGRMTSFEYDAQNQLLAIVGPSGCRYEIHRQSSGQNTIVEFYAVENDDETLLQICTFDNLGRLINTSPGDPSSQRPLYSIEYQYYGDTTQVLSVQQTDNTSYLFTYDEQNRVDQFNIGSQGNSIEYNSPNSSSLIDSQEIKTDFIFDNNARLQQLIQQRGYESYINPPDVTNYTYAPAGQIASIQKPDGGIEKFEYSDILGQRTRHVLPNGQVTEFYYHDETTDRPKLRNKVQYLGDVDNNNEPVPVITSYIYDDNYDNQNARHSFLRFEVSSEGRVTEYRPDLESGNSKSVRTYLNGIYTASRPVQVAPTLGEMQDWITQQNPQQISLTEYDYSSHGQPQEIRQYVTIDSEGNGIEDVHSSQTNFNWDLLGGWESKQIRQQGYGVIPAINTFTTQKFDSLHRLTRVTEFMDADGKEVRETQYEYDDPYNGEQSQVTTIYPNQKAEIKLFNVQGQLDSKQEKVGLQGRTTLYNRDSGGRVNETVHPDGMITYTLYDRQQRLGFLVDVNGVWDQSAFNPQGIVTQFDYDRVHRYKKTTRYAQAINIKDWVNADQYTPEACFLIPLLNINDPRNRCTYEFYDASNRLAYQVDEEQYFIEFRYDNLNQLIGKIAYKEKLTSEQMQALLQGQSLNLKPDPSVDRWAQYFYDTDGKKIGEQDPAGYVTQYLRDAGGRIQEKIIYFNPTEHKTDFKDVLPPPNPQKDAHTFYFRDARGQCTAEIDAEGYYTEHEYMACGLTAKSRRYANKFDSVIASVAKQSSINKNLPQAPEPSSEDHVTVFQYDLLNRLTATINQAQTGSDLSTIVNLQSNTLQYDLMDHITSKKTQDLLDPKSASPDKQRSMQTIYDSWGKIIKETNPFIAQLLVDIDANPDLTPEQKVERKNDVLEKQSTRHHYDATGLKLGTTDSLNQKTLYYYDVARRPIISIDPKGIVKEITLDNFNNSTKVRRYYTKLNPEILSKLTGGFINNELRAELDKLQNDKKDSINYYERNLRGLISQQTDPEGYFSFFEYNAFKECEKEFLPVDLKVPSLKIEHEFEQRGLETKTTKSVGQLSTQTSQEFNNPYGKQTAYINEVQARTDKDYDRLGRFREVVQTIESATKAKHTVESDAFNRKKTEVNSLGEKTTHQFDQIQHTHTIVPPVQSTQEILTLNIFGEVVQRENSLGNKKTWQHAPDGKVQQFSDALNNTTIDIFDTQGQNTLHKDADGALTAFQRDASGFLTERVQDADPQFVVIPAKDGVQVKGVMPAKGSIQVKSVMPALSLCSGQAPATIQEIDTKCHASESWHPGNYNNIFLDATSPRASRDDKVHLNLKTTFTRNSFGDAEDILDPNKVHHEATFDRRSLQIETKISLGENKPTLVTQKNYNGQSQQTNLIQGELNNLNQYDEKTQIDGLGRVTGKIIDPNGLTIAHLQHLDGAGRVIAKIDPRSTPENPLITRQFYNDLNKLRFEVDADGGLKEWCYDTEGKVTLYREYGLKIEPDKINDQTSLVTLIGIAALKRNSQDSLLYHFYDANGRERFRVNSLGTVLEIRYDNASREIENIIYASQVNIASVPKMTTDELATLMQTKINLKEDRHTYYVLDAEGQQRFIIDPKGYVTEQQFDKLKRTISKKLYDTPVTNSARIAKLKPEQVLIHPELKANPERDRTVYNVYDARNKPIFTVNGEGAVVRYDHDNNGNLLSQCEFANCVPSPNNYEALVNFLHTLKPDPEKGDRITKHQVDNANRLISETNALNLSDQYILDTVGNTRQHIDKAQNNWNYQHDRAKRQTDEFTPEMDVAFVSYNSDTQKLSSEQQKTSVQKHVTYDKASNKRFVIEGQNLISKNGALEARTFEVKYNSVNKIQETIVPQVAVNDPTQKADFNKRPEVIKDITTEIVYDGKQLEIGTKNAAGNWNYTVYDSEKRPIYQIDQLGAVTKIERNAFGEPIKETRFAQTIQVDFSEYVKKSEPIPPTVVDNAVAPFIKDPNNRITFYTRDQRGDVVLEQKGPVFYYTPDPETKQPSFGVDFATTKREFNAAREAICESKLINPKLNAWTETIYWRNRNGKLVAQANKVSKIGDLTPSFFVQRDKLNAFDQAELHTEYAVSLQQSLTFKTFLQDLDAWLAKLNPEENRATEYEYDLIGQILSETALNVTIQRIVMKSGVPIMEDVLLPSLTRSYQYAPIKCEGPISVIYEDGTIAYFDYDKRGLKIAEKGVPRTSQDSNGNKVVWTPLTEIQRNGFGQNAVTIRYKQGASKISDPDDQYSYTQFDKRGMPKNLQDAEGNLTARTFTETKKAAREWNYLTNWQPGQNPIRHIDEKQFTYDKCDRPTKMEILRDNQPTKLTTESILNTFGETVAEGLGDGTFPAKQAFDALGNVWKDNFSKGATTLKFRDLMGKESASLQSATDDLDKINYDLDQFTDLLKWDITRLENMQTYRDTANRMCAKMAPAYYDQGHSGTQVLPLAMAVGSKYPAFGTTSITWVLPQETNVQPHFFIWPKGNKNAQRELKINVIGNSCGVDVSYNNPIFQLPTDVYEYEINYYLNDPTKDQPQLLYQTTGTLQLDNGNSNGSLHVVATVQNNNQLILTGNTFGMDAVKVYQNDQLIKDVLVKWDNNKSAYVADLHDLASGQYTIKPVMHGETRNEMSLPFTIYTNIPALQPLAKEIPCKVSLSIADEKSGQINWTVPAEYMNQPAKVIFTYISDDNAKHSITALIDQNKSNTVQFPNPVVTLLSISLAVQTQQGEWLPLLVSQPPSQSPHPIKPISRLQTRFPNEKGYAYFEEHPVAGKGDCGFITLGTTRQQLVEKLLTVKNNANAFAKARKQLAPEILNAFMSGDLTPPDGNWQILSAKNYQQQTKLDECLREIRRSVHDISIRTLNVGQLALWLQKNKRVNEAKELIATQQEALEASHALQQYCEKLEVFDYYLDALKKNLWLGYESALLYAELSNISLNIWRRDEKNPFHMKLLQKHAAKNSQNTIHMLHTQGFTHFNLLSEIDFNKTSELSLLTDRSNPENNAWIASSRKNAPRNDNSIVMSAQDNNNQSAKLVMPALSLRSGQAPAGIQSRHSEPFALLEGGLCEESVILRSEATKDLILRSAQDGKNIAQFSELEDDFVMVAEDKLEEDWEPIPEENKKEISIESKNEIKKPKNVVNYSFGPNLLLYISPVSNPDQIDSLKYLDTSLDIMRKWKNINVMELLQKVL